MGEIIEISSKCSFSWQYLKEMKETNVDGLVKSPDLSP